MLVLLALFFLTVISLSPAVVTETEMLIGADEQVACAPEKDDADYVRSVR